MGRRGPGRSKCRTDIELRDGPTPPAGHGWLASRRIRTELQVRSVHVSLVANRFRICMKNRVGVAANRGDWSCCGGGTVRLHGCRASTQDKQRSVPRTVRVVHRMQLVTELWAMQRFLSGRDEKRKSKG